MGRKLAVCEVMTTSPRTVSLNESLLNAKRLMNKYSVRHLPVTERAEVVGIISDRDIRLAESVRGGRVSDKELLVKHVCLFNPYIVDEDTALDLVLVQMAKRRIGSVIVTREGHLSGILTTVDICRAFAKVLRGELQ